MARETILVVEDDENILELVRYNLAKENYRIKTATTGEAALDFVREGHPDLIVLDLMLPEIDGLEVCRRIRQNEARKHVPIVMLTAKGEESDVVAGLEVGADDYITKPFSPRVLIARIRAALRRRGQEEPSADATVNTKHLLIHPGRHEAVVDGARIELTFTEFRVLHLLARRPGWVFTRGQIVDAVRGHDYVVTDRAVDVQIAGLRKKLGAVGECIKTVRGVGYKYQE
ncbi:MAG: response regulator transcription factor [Candidatus Hydrogenedentes bacterium]|nr:response regulator transcription factor [Candidatus Hydrogenedentota bacterium]